MTVGAGLRGRQIEQHLLAIDLLEKLMTARAGHVAVFALESEGGSLIVIEGRRLPLSGIVAVRALRDLVREELGELTRVHVFVALLAFLGSFFEIHVGQPRFQVGRLMAVDTGHGAMRALQRERSRAVVKSVQFVPGLGGVASLATHGLAVLAQLGHALVELAFVDILVATGAGQIFEVIRNLRLRLIFVSELVAIPAWYGDMAAGEFETRLLMLSEREG